MKGGFCVSTVSIVSDRAPGSTAVVAGCSYCLGRRLARPKVVIVIADDADGADGIFGPRMDPDHPPARPSWLKAVSIPRTRRNVCARRKRPRDRAGVLGPTSGPARGGRELECGFTFRREPADFHLHVVSSHARTWSRRGLVLHRRPKSQICAAIALAVHTGPWW